MNKLQQRIKSLLHEIKEEQEKRFYYLIEISYSTETFYRRVNSVSDYYKKLSNSKTSLPGNPSNREWWKKLNPTGYYDFEPNERYIILSFVMRTEVKLNELEFKARVKKIVPYVDVYIQNKKQKDY